jgi:hypothetical protein
MDFGIINIEYFVLKDDVILHSGTCPSFLLNSISDMYCDFINSEYLLLITYNDTKIKAHSPTDFDQRKAKV